MDRETNIASILALDDQISENATIALKRARNSLLNVSKIPPEVLGDIFRWNVIPKGDFGGLEKRSHNFLVVCHHWFEVATHTPDLWCFWGNTPEDWSRWYRRSGTAPLDLVLGVDGYDGRHFDADLEEALRDRAAKDTIRSVHLAAGNTKILRTIIASLTANPKELRSNSIVSFVLQNLNNVPLDACDFFAYYRFPKLQRLELRDCTIASWDHLASRTPVLTTLKLDVSYISPFPTTPQLLSILASNPALQEVGLSGRAVPIDGGGESTLVQLHNLKKLNLHGRFQHVLKFLHRLDHPRNMDHLSLILEGCNLVDIPEVVGPYLRDHLRRRDKVQGGLNLLLTSGPPSYRAHTTLRVGNGRGIDFSDPAQAKMNTFIAITMLLNEKPHGDLRAKAILDLVAYTPLEEIVYFKGVRDTIVAEDGYTQFPKLRALSFNYVPLAKAFPNPNLDGDGKMEIFPSLEHVLLEGVRANHYDSWKPLTTFLACHMSTGNRLGTLVIADHESVVPQDVKEEIRSMVRELKFGRLNLVSDL